MNVADGDDLYVSLPSFNECIDLATSSVEILPGTFPIFAVLLYEVKYRS